MIERGRFEVGGWNFAMGHEAAKFLATLEHVGYFGTVVRRPIQRAVAGSLVGNGNRKTRAKSGERLIGQFLFLMGGIGTY